MLTRDAPRLILGWLWQRRFMLFLLFVGIVLPLYIFGQLADEILEQEGFVWDEPILLFFRGFASPILDWFMVSLSQLGTRYGVVPLDVSVVLILLLSRRWVAAVFFGLATGGAALMNVLAKLTFQRIRPDLWVSIAPETTYSFPSGHAMGSMACVVALSVLLWDTRWRWPVIIGGGLFVFLVGVSRVYLGVHYPSDILAGWMASEAWVLGVATIISTLR